MPSTSAPLDKLKEQLAQVDALIKEGVLRGAQAQRARDDIERQILARVAGVPATEAPAPDVARPSRGLLMGVILFVLVFGGGSYAFLGNHAGWNVGPGDGGESAEQAQTAAPHAVDAEQIKAMIAKLVKHLQDKPDDAEGWTMLGRSYTAQGLYAEALPAYKRAHELRPNDAQSMADYADGLAMANNRSLEGEPERLIMQAIKLDPTNIKSLALAGTVAFNHANYKAAIDYWERAVKSSGPDSNISSQLKGAIDEARQRAGLPALAAADAPPGPAAPGAPSAPGNGGGAAAEGATGSAGAAAPAGASVAGRLTLRADVRSQVSPEDTVFIYARAADGPRMPLAILRKKVSDLPLNFSLDDSMAMNPAARLSTTPKVVVGARISRTGNALPAPGDWQVLSAPVPVGTRDLRLEIGELVR